MKLLKVLIIFLFAIVINACGSSGDDDDGGSSGSTIPADAATFTSANAESFARAALAQIDTVTATTDLALKQSESSEVNGALRMAVYKIFRQSSAARQFANRSITENCGQDASSGSITYETTESAGSETGSITFDNCDLGGILIDGNFTFTSTSNELTGAYTATGEGGLDFSFDTEQFSIEMDFDISGNDISGEFSETFNFSLSGITGGGFSLTTTQPITGVGFDVTGGQIVISGANATRIRVTVVGTNLVDIELDDGSGTFQPHSSGVAI